MSEQNELPERIWILGDPREDDDAVILIEGPQSNSVEYVRATTPVPVDAARKAAEEIFQAFRKRLTWRVSENVITELESIITKHLSSPVDVEAMQRVVDAGQQWLAERVRYNTDPAATCAKYGMAADALATSLESITTVPSPDKETNETS